MVYLNNIPQPTNILATQSQPQILENFSQLDTQFAIDHTAFSVGGADAGKHKHVTLPEQGLADPDPGANEVSVYSKEGTYGGTTESILYVQKESAGTVIALTGQDPIINNNGSTFLAGGMILKWGFSAATTGGTVVNFASAFPTNCYEVIVTTQTAGVHAAVTNKAVGSFTVVPSANVTIGYIAIGN